MSAQHAPGRRGGAGRADGRDRPWWLWWREPSTLRGALSLMVGLLGVLWIIELVDLATGHALIGWGLRPRELDGLIGILAAPLLHAGIGHLLGNSLPFAILGWFAIAAGGFGDWLAATAIIVGAGGLATWAIAPAGLIVGVSGVTMGWLGYLLARAAFSRRAAAIALAVIALIYFGALMRGMLPAAGDGISWQGHLCGFGAGILAGWILSARASTGPRAAAGAAQGPGPAGRLR